MVYLFLVSTPFLDCPDCIFNHYATVYTFMCISSYLLTLNSAATQLFIHVMVISFTNNLVKFVHMSRSKMTFLKLNLSG
jgi:hypothetical protein